MLYTNSAYKPTQAIYRMDKKIESLNARLTKIVRPSMYLHPEPDEFFQSIGMPKGREPWEWRSVGMWRPSFDGYNDRQARVIVASRDDLGVKRIEVWEKSYHFKDRLIGSWADDDPKAYYITWEAVIPLMMDTSYFYFYAWARYWLECAETGRDLLREYWQPIHPHLFQTAALGEAEKAIATLELLSKEIRHDQSKKFTDA